MKKIFDKSGISWNGIPHSATVLSLPIDNGLPNKTEVGPVTQYPIPAITVPGRMRYSRHKRSGISYGCHNESPGLLLAAISDLKLASL